MYQKVSSSTNGLPPQRNERLHSIWLFKRVKDCTLFTFFGLKISTISHKTNEQADVSFNFERKHESNAGNLISAHTVFSSFWSNSTQHFRGSEVEMLCLFLMINKKCCTVKSHIQEIAFKKLKFRNFEAWKT